MLDIHGITGARQAATGRFTAPGAPAPATPDIPAGDSTEFSAEGVSAARSLVGSERYDDVRLARVEEAKRKIEEGLYRIQEVVFLVAQRISRFVT